MSRRHRPVVLAIALALLGAACTSNDDPPTADQPPAANETTLGTAPGPSSSRSRVVADGLTQVLVDGAAHLRIPLPPGWSADLDGLQAPATGAMSFTGDAADGPPAYAFTGPYMPTAGLPDPPEQLDQHALSLHRDLHRRLFGTTPAQVATSEASPLAGQIVTEEAAGDLAAAWTVVAEASDAAERAIIETLHLVGEPGTYRWILVIHHAADEAAAAAAAELLAAVAPEP